MTTKVRPVVKESEPRTYELESIRFRVVREDGNTRSRYELSSPETSYRFIRDAGFIPDDAKEHFGVLLLDTKNGFVAHHPVSVGTLSASLVHPREVFAPACRVMGVASIVLFHNHPSGDPTPSREDLRLTRQLVEGARLLDLRIHDHIIIGDGTGTFVSLAQTGAI
jgi:DNA repair protein RadC